MENKTKFVDFFTYCPKCVHYTDHPETEPCNECLTVPVNVNSHKPIMYKEGDNVKQRG